MIIETLKAILDAKKGELFRTNYFIAEDGDLLKETVNGYYTEFCYLPELNKMVVSEDKIELITIEDGEEYICIIENDLKRSINDSLKRIDELCKKMGLEDKPVPTLTLKESIVRFEESCKRLDESLERSRKYREILDDINRDQIKLNSEIKERLNKNL